MYLHYIRFCCVPQNGVIHLLSCVTRVKMLHCNVFTRRKISNKKAVLPARPHMPKTTRVQDFEPLHDEAT